MMMFLVLKESVRSFYGRYAAIVDVLIKFLYSFVALWMLAENIGFRTELTSLPVLLLLSLICAFLPWGAISLLLGLVMLAHIYAVSLEAALIAGVFLLFVALLYFGLEPAQGCWVVLTPLAFLLKIPLAVGLLAGLSGGIACIVPSACGVVVYYIIFYVKQNAAALAGDTSADIAQRFIQILKAITADRTMFIMIAVCAAGILVVWLLRSLSVHYAWSIATAAGVIAQLAVLFVGDNLFDVSLSVGQLLAGGFLAVLIAVLYQFLFFAVDYTRTEYTQFEDDDYVYYVKAVPKVSVARTDVRVQRINNPKRSRQAHQS